MNNTIFQYISIDKPEEIPGCLDCLKKYRNRSDHDNAKEEKELFNLVKYKVTEQVDYIKGNMKYFHTILPFARLPREDRIKLLNMSSFINTDGEGANFIIDPVKINEFTNLLSTTPLPDQQRDQIRDQRAQIAKLNNQIIHQTAEIAKLNNELIQLRTRVDAASS